MIDYFQIWALENPKNMRMTQTAPLVIVRQKQLNVWFQYVIIRTIKVCAEHLIYIISYSLKKSCKVADTRLILQKRKLRLQEVKSFDMK